MIIAWDHTLCATENVANKNHPIDSYREQHGPNRGRSGERGGLLVIKQNTPGIKHIGCHTVQLFDFG